jgi:Holliday junction resolvase RusA-like endonuclease
MRHIGGGRIIHDKGPELTTWRTAVAKAAKAAGAQPVHKDVPLRVDMTFWLPKPKTVTREKPTAKIDLDKLIRAVNDALGGSTQPVAFTDDGQIVHMEVFKHYADESNPVGVLVRISLA